MPGFFIRNLPAFKYWTTWIYQNCIEAKHLIEKRYAMWRTTVLNFCCVYLYSLSVQAVLRILSQNKRSVNTFWFEYMTCKANAYITLGMTAKLKIRLFFLVNLFLPYSYIFMEKWTSSIYHANGHFSISLSEKDIITSPKWR